MIHDRTGKHANDTGGSGSFGSGQQHISRRPGSAKITLKDKILNAEGNLEELMALAPKIPPFANEDLIGPYKRQLHNFSAKQLAQLMLAPSADIEGVIVRMLTQDTDRQLLVNVAAALPKGSKERARLFREAGENMAALEPKTLAETLSLISPEDWLDIGKGLESRARAVQSDAARMKLIEGYLAATDIPEIRTQLQALWLAKNAADDPAAAAEWLLQQKGSEAIYPSDRVVIGALAARSPEKAVDFVNQLLDQGDGARAGRAVAAILDTTKQTDPIGSLRWVEGLPRDLHDYGSLVATAFSRVYFRNPEQIAPIIDSTKDEYLLAIYFRLKASLDESQRKRAETERK